MMKPMLREIVGPILFVFGVGYLAATLRIVVDGIRFLTRRSKALVIWPGRKRPHDAMGRALGVILGVVVVVELVILRRPQQVFGEGMMFLYYACAVPLSHRIGRGFYEDGIWAEGGFIPYANIGGITWRDGQEPTLVIASRIRRLARRLVVPGRHYAAVRRLLRDRIAAHDIHFSGTGLNLETHDEREDV
jgi:hypothetical protein